MSGAVQIYTPAPHAPSLLPSASPDWMLAHSLVNAARRPLPAHLVKDVWNPATCPVDLIKYQCAGLGLELWDDTWPEAKQREIYAGLWRLKRNKTKLKGIKGYLELVDAELVAAHLPKQRFWWSGGQSQAQRDATMAEMPRVRIYPFAEPEAAAPGKMFWGRSAWGFGTAWQPSDAVARYAGRAVYVDGATITPVTLRGIDGPLDPSVQVELSAPASPAKMFWGRSAWGRAAWMPSDAADHVLAITPDADAPGFAVPRGLVPASVRPIRTSEAVAAPAGKAFWGRSAWGYGAAWKPSDAESHVFDEVVLFDPSRPVPSRQPYSFWGWSRWGRLPYTAEVRVDITIQPPARQFGWGKPWGRGFFWRRADMKPFWDAVAAVRIAKAERDFVWINTQLTAPIQFSAGLRFGEADFPTFGSRRTLT